MSQAPRRIIVKLRLARRASQAIFLVLFVGVSSRWFFHFDPLAALLALVASHRVHQVMAWSLVTVAVTALLGRVFCGWVCPLGTLQAIAAAVWPIRPKKAVIQVNRSVRLRGVKLAVLFASLGAALLGSTLGADLDPIALTEKGLLLSWLPGASSVLSALGKATVPLFGDFGLGFIFLAKLVDPVGRWNEPAQFSGAWICGLLLLGLLMAARRWPRWWCRHACPLGALLGFASWPSLLGFSKKNEQCTHCDRCLEGCAGACGPDGDTLWLKAECHICLNCEASCPEGVLALGARVPASVAESTPPDLSRRRVLASAALGVAVPPILRAGSAFGIDDRPSPERIRPPGSRVEEQLLARCIRCGECLKICPYNALHPALAEAGVEGFWTPVVIPRLGPCEASCTRCSNVCPTGALMPLTPAQRKRIPVKIGTAFVDRGRCLPWAMNRSCSVCEEFCPVSPKAISGAEHQETGATDEAGFSKPVVDPNRCIGCGACENACPVRDRPAIRVTSVGESRSRSNRLLLFDDSERNRR